MAIAKALHVVTVGAAKVGVMLPDFYDSIDTIVGVTKATGVASYDVRGSLNGLIRDGQILHLRISWLPSGATKTKTANIICDMTKAPTAAGDLIGKDFRGGKIKGAGVKRHVQFT